MVIDVVWNPFILHGPELSHIGFLPFDVTSVLDDNLDLLSNVRIQRCQTASQIRIRHFGTA